MTTEKAEFKPKPGDAVRVRHEYPGGKGRARSERDGRKATYVRHDRSDDDYPHLVEFKDGEEVWVHSVKPPKAKWTPQPGERVVIKHEWPIPANGIRPNSAYDGLEGEYVGTCLCTTPCGTPHKVRVTTDRGTAAVYVHSVRRVKPKPESKPWEPTTSEIVMIVGAAENGKRVYGQRGRYVTHLSYGDYPHRVVPLADGLPDNTFGLEVNVDAVVPLGTKVPPLETVLRWEVGTSFEPAPRPVSYRGSFLVTAVDNTGNALGYETGALVAKKAAVARNYRKMQA